MKGEFIDFLMTDFDASQPSFIIIKSILIYISVYIGIYILPENGNKRNRPGDLIKAQLCI